MRIIFFLATLTLISFTLKYLMSSKIRTGLRNYHYNEVLEYHESSRWCTLMLLPFQSNIKLHMDWPESASRHIYDQVTNTNLSNEHFSATMSLLTINSPIVVTSTAPATVLNLKCLFSSTVTASSYYKTVIRS